MARALFILGPVRPRQLRDMKICYQPIGVVNSPFKAIEGIPIQPSRAKGVSGTVVLHPEFVEGLKDLDGFTYIILLCHLHKAKPFELSVVPFLDHQPRGLFSTRAPSRPNPIGLSVVRLVGISDNILSISEVDILDGTPVLDIKPYVGEFDERANAQFGWLQGAREGRAVSDKRFSQ